MANIEQLQEKAKTIRYEILDMLVGSGSGHPGGSLSATDIVTALYFEEMNLDPQNPDWEDRDRFVLSKGHAAPVLYATLAEKGYFPKEDLGTLRQLGSHLQGHPDMKKTPGVDMTTGSLGQGISAAVGMALAGQLDEKDYNVYSILGDGELQEGQVWEAALAAVKFGLDNLVGIVDNNRIQLVGRTEEVMSSTMPVVEKFESFGWHVIEINGHDMEEILDAFAKAKEVTGKPVMIVANTVKGKGVSYMEDNPAWHGKTPGEDKAEQALSELE
ncbi:transketolase, beta subunit [Halobacteroides halobius DSM 5150]|uniref:Transketolase, beta subunit n=1 Tax=Halobacteroides halobius (strain ATCC 35273 / DSM 5150 / MD-1) TaxID=748449 RepID=L0KDC5_HALHC|nr:transketolase [Halobacteroides halobius]AGB42098.1 transketolase, beta subunit [Halobacteroides halobius DSM 5150]